MHLSSLFLLALLSATQAASPPAHLELPNCLVTLIDEAQVAAQEPGILTEVKVREGQAVEAGQVLAQIDDAKSRMEQRVALAKLAVADEKASDDINVRYANASANVAKAEYDTNKAANDRVNGAVPQTEMNRLRLKCVETLLAIDKAKLEMRVAGHEAKVAKAESDAAEENMNRRRIRSPLDGVVVDLHRHVGEWVQPGDQVLHVIRMDRLWVEGYVRAADYARAELEDRPVSVNAILARGQQVPLPGKIVYVKPTTEAGGTFLVRAEVQNEKRNGHWILNPGLGAAMTIHLR